MKDCLKKGQKFCVGEEWFGRNDMGIRDETKVVQIENDRSAAAIDSDPVDV